MDFSKILENKPLLFGIIGGLAGIVVLIVIIIAIAANNGGNSDNNAKVIGNEPLKANVDLLTTDNIGKAIEIQALLARQGITVDRQLDGTKSKLTLNAKNCSTLTKKCTVGDRDKALIAIVESGLVDQNVGLEIFDKGDFTSTKEDKKIRLARAINGELARLIRKIDPISNASVFISIPEQTMFSSMQKPVTATVQITIPVGDKLDQLKVKAITNLLLGSVSGLTSENISITDTNGNVYSSMIDASDEMLQRLEENDKYMQQKVAAQLDRLIGKGNYVVTVSTFLTQSPVEKFSIVYDPDRKTSVNEQSFTEGLGDQTQDSNGGINAVSVYLPNGLPAAGSNSSQNRSYSRSATETQYGVTKTQINEYMKPGVVEEISVAVTLEKNSLPANTTLEELKELVANAASPRVNPDNVSIAFADSLDPYLAADRPVNLPKPDETGNPWWLAVALSAVGLLIVFKAVSDKVKQVQEANRREVEALRAHAAEQERQLNEINNRASELTARQSELAQGLLEQQQREFLPAGTTEDLMNSLSSLSSQLSDTDADEAGEKIKSWIEQG